MTQTIEIPIYPYLNAGLCVIPVNPQTKRPLGQWKPYQTRKPNSQEVDEWLQTGLQSVAVVCGAVSGCLEIIDIDDNSDETEYAASDFWYPLRDAIGHLIEQYNFPVWRTGGNGYQFAYRCEHVDGNLKLAWVPNQKQQHGRSIAIETRGEGGYAVIPPSLHPSGQRYELLSGDLCNVPVIPAGVRDEILAAARSLCLMPYTKTEIESVRQEARLGHQSNGVSVIDAYNERNNVGDLLAQHGYTQGYRGRYSRPGQPESMGVVVVDNVSFHWSSNDPLNRINGTGRPLPVDAFNVYTEFEHNGDVKQAVKSAARALGIENEQRQAGSEEPSQSLIDELATLEDADLKVFALDNVDRLAEKTLADYSKFTEAMQGRGVASEWLRRELRPAVNEEKRRKQNGVTWLDYVKSANDLGYEFRLNVLEDALEVNAQRMSTVLAAELLSHLHAKGLRNTDVATRAFLTDANQNHHHPVKDYLEQLVWDGVDHIAGLSRYFTDAHELITYADGTQHTVIYTWLLRWLTGAVAKVYDSQEAQNPMLVLDGGQGRGKSYFVKWLASPLQSMHFEGSIRPDDKDYLRYLSTRWIWEVSELGATMRKADREALKSFITLQDVTYRPAHGQYVLHKPALASFIGTVNFEGALLNDPTGHRRFLPVEITNLDWEYSKNIDVNQVWAQAYQLYKTGASWKLTDEEKAVHKSICEHYEVEDVLEGNIREWFRIEPGNDGLFEHTTTIADKLRTYASVNISRNHHAAGMLLAATLNKMGLQKKKRENRWGYVGIQFDEEKTTIQPSS